MIGAIAGDIAGSVYEARPMKSKAFDFFAPESRFTDDSVLTAAVADAILHQGDYADCFHRYFHRYPDAGFGGSFFQWARLRSRQPYYSFGNGSAMRVSPVGFAFDTLDEVLSQAKKTAAVTHNHPEGIKGAQATAAAVFLARTGSEKAEIKAFVTERFGYDLDRSLEAIRPVYRFDVSCQGSVPESILAFLAASDYEDAVRNAVSLGGDADTMAAIAGGIAEACYGVPDNIKDEAMARLDDDLRAVVRAFYARFMPASGSSRD